MRGLTWADIVKLAADAHPEAGKVRRVLVPDWFAKDWLPQWKGGNIGPYPADTFEGPDMLIVFDNATATVDLSLWRRVLN